MEQGVLPFKYEAEKNNRDDGAGVIDQCSQEDWNASDCAFRVGKEVKDKSKHV